MLTLHYIDEIILVSAFLALFLSILIMQKYRNSLANRTLSIMFFVYSLILAEMLLWDIELYKIFPKMMLVLMGVTFLMSPLHYLYARYLTRFSEKFKPKHLYHFLPFALYEICIIPVLLVPEKQLVQNLSGESAGGISAASLIFNWVIMVYIIIYAVLVVIVVKKYSVRIKNVFSSIESVKLGWLRNTAVMFAAAIGMYIIENMLNTAGIISNQYALSSIIAGAFVFVLGYLVLLKSEVFAAPEFAEEIELIASIEETEKEQPGLSLPKYEKSGLTHLKGEEYAAKLLKLMDEKKPYLDSALTLNKLADLIAIPSYHLSEIINVYLHQNFFDFINKYRIEKVKADLKNPQKANYTLLAIALDSGFNSKSSFNNIFKKMTGMTPSQYKKI